MVMIIIIILCSFYITWLWLCSPLCLYVLFMLIWLCVCIKLCPCLFICVVVFIHMFMFMCLCFWLYACECLCPQLFIYVCTFMFVRCALLCLWWCIFISLCLWTNMIMLYMYHVRRLQHTWRVSYNVVCVQPWQWIKTPIWISHCLCRRIMFECPYQSPIVSAVYFPIICIVVSVIFVFMYPILFPRISSLFILISSSENLWW